MKIAIYLTLTTAWLLYISEMTITFKPFSVSFEKPFLPFAWLFLIISIVLFQQQSYRDGANDTIEKVKEVINDIKNERHD